MLRIVCCVLVLASALLVASCGTVIWTETNGEPAHDTIDGAVMTYALAKGHVSFQAEIKSNTLTLTTDQKVVAEPDTSAPYRQLVYNHSGISEDDISIQMDGALVKSISTTTTDKSVPIIQNITGLLSQIATTQSAFDKNKAVAAVIGDQKCPDKTVTFVQGITFHNEKVYWPPQKGTPCEIKIIAGVIPQGPPLQFQAFAKSSDEGLHLGDICDLTYAFCFRLGQIYRVKAKALATIDGKLAVADLPPFYVTAPAANSIGYARFDRRAFVANKTTLTFDTNGVLNSFAATNPSEVLGSITLPTAFAAGIVAAAALHR